MSAGSTPTRTTPAAPAPRYGIHLGSTYGFVAFALGRGLHAVLALVPMLLGAALGAAAARRLDGARAGPGVGGRGPGSGCAAPSPRCSA